MSIPPFAKRACTVLFISTLSYAAMIALNLAAAVGADHLEITRQISKAFLDHELIDSGFSPNDTRRGINQFNDCLILQSLLLSSGSLMIDSVSTRVVADQKPCEKLRALSENRMVETKLLYDYNRYLWGARTVTSIGLGFVSLRSMRLLIEAAVYAILLATFVAGLVNRAKRNDDPDSSGNVLGYAISIVCGVLLVFYSLHYFVPNVGHGYSELVIAAFLGTKLAIGNSRQRGIMVSLSALFGAWTAYFELLTGPLVVGVVVVGLVSALSADEESDRSPSRRAWENIGYYCLAFIFVLLLHQIVVTIVTGKNAFLPFLTHLAIRLQLHHALDTPVPELWRTPSNMATYGLRDVAESVVNALPILTFGSPTLAKLISGASFVMVAAGVLFAYVSRIKAYRDQIWAIASLLSVVPLWYIVFSNHTVIHAFGMVRLVALEWALCITAFMIGIVALRTARMRRQYAVK
jgi:hypothetical protein